MPPSAALIIWWVIFSVISFILIFHFRYVLPSLRDRMKNSVSWPMSAKLVNGICWAGPFTMIPIFHQMYPYLVLLGIGAGNICTYALLRKYSNVSSKEQYLVGVLSVSFIPITIIINYGILHNSTEFVPLISRLFIGIAYGVGGLYALFLAR